MNSGTGVCLGLLLWNGRRCGPATGPDRTVEAHGSHDGT